jgi:hypothetical protein
MKNDPPRGTSQPVARRLDAATEAPTIPPPLELGLPASQAGTVSRHGSTASRIPDDPLPATENAMGTKIMPCSTGPVVQVAPHKDRDPALFARDVGELAEGVSPDRPGSPRLALGLDLGTTTGYSFTRYQPDRPFDLRSAFVVMGQWDLAAGPYDSGAIRFARLYQFLDILQPDLIAYEEPRFTPSEPVHKVNVAAVLGRAMTSVEFLGGLKTTTCLWAERNGVACQAYPIGRIKKRATGRGNAGKPEMIAAANSLFGVGLEVAGYETSGVDNIADSAIVLLLGLEDYAKYPGRQP